jgi:hypothetical protein
MSTHSIRLLRYALLLLAAGYASCVFAAHDGVSSDWTAVYDFLVQDVCLDGNGRAVIGLSPLDQHCNHHRDLLSDEALPYHKADWPGDEDTRRQPAGYERSDSIPLRSRLLGPLVVQTFDFGAGNGRKFGAFDHGDGGQVVAFSEDSASIILTEDGGRGLQLMAGPGCTHGQIAGPLLLDSWVIVAKGAGTMESGSALAKLRIVTDASCPAAFDYAYTEWHTATLRYRASLSGDLTAPLLTLISSHFGGKSVTSADHLERFYFTRELGWTRWERWQNTNRNKDPDRSVRASRRLNGSRRCRPLEPAPGGEWLMTDCREWTNIAGPDSAAGDKPEFWVERLRENPLTRELFAD